MTVRDIDFNKDYYGILGLTKDASKQDIKKAYRKLSLEYHPDRHTNDSEEDKKKAEQMMQDVNEANSVLSNDELRRAYDSGPQEMHFGGGFNPFGSMSERMRREQEMQRMHGQPAFGTVYVNFDDICNGIKDMEITYKRYVRCKKCNGSGGTDVKQCPHCHGTGQFVRTTKHFGVIMQESGVCPHCHGTGNVIEHVCEECNGSGLTQIYDTYHLTASTEHLVQDDAKLFVGYYGSESQDPNGTPGELVFNVKHVLPIGMKIILDEYGHWSIVERREIPYYDMILGCKQVVNTPSGKKIAITVPEGFDTEKHLRARGHGFTVPDYGTGDYMLAVSMEKKKSLTNEEKKIFEQLRDLNKKE